MPEPFFVFDLDGTLISQKGRMHLRGVDWHAYNLAAITSPPVAGNLKMCLQLQQCYDLVINTARPEELRGETEEWLFKHGVAYTHMFMRRTGRVFTAAGKIAALLGGVGDARERCLGWFDDDPEVIRRGRQCGFNMLQVSE